MDAHDLHTYLKQKCHNVHQSLHQNALMHRLLDGRSSREDYSAVLLAFLGAYFPLEHTILDFLDQHAIRFDYRKRLKYPAILSDLAELDVETPSLPVGDKCIIEHPAQLVGSLYVLEGSMLGSQVICQRLFLQYGKALPLTFFGGYGALTQVFWQEFLTFLQATCPPDDWYLAEQSAQAVFAAVSLQLEAAIGEIDA